MRTRLLTIASASAFAVALTLTSCTAQQPTPVRDPANSPTVPITRTSANDDITESRRNAITRAIERVSPAVVGINVTEVQEFRVRDPYFDDPFFQEFFGRQGAPQTYKQEVRGLGSGFIISPDGYVVTNDHVAGAATKVIVTTTDGKEHPATVVGSDPTSDVALLKIEGGNFPYIELGNSDEVIVGEWAIALGNPFGLFEINSKPTVTVGVISNTGVNLRPQENRIYKGMIQTDAAISSGNSGGPLVNSLGQVIGVNATIYSTSQSRMGSGSIGIGFAIPINRAREIFELLKKKGSIDRDFWTGMSIRQINENIARYLKLNSTEGVVVVDVAVGSPADKAGLQQGDVIKAINGEIVKTEDAALTLIYDARVGETLKLKMIRAGNELETSLVLAKRGR